MRLTLTVVAGGEPGRVWEFAQGATVRVGASSVGDVVLAGDEWVAATHCAVYWHEGAWRVRDLGEGGGTWRNGVGVTDEAVESGDVIQCGRSQLRVAWVVEAAGAVAEEARDPKAEALATLRALPGRLYAVLDAAKDPEVLQLLRRSGYRYECLYTGWAREVYGEAAPYLVQLRKQGRLLEQLVERGWGKGWGVFLSCSDCDTTAFRTAKKLLIESSLEDQPRIRRFFQGGFPISGVIPSRIQLADGTSCFELDEFAASILMCRSS